MSTKPIVNRVDQSGLVLVDFTEIIRDTKIASLDISAWLYKDLIVKESLFKAALEELDLSQFEGKFLHVYCSKNVIIPQWVFMLLSSSLGDACDLIVYGSEKELKHLIVKNYVESNISTYKDERVIVKGCGDDFLPNTYFIVGQLLKKVVKSLMYGEACSAFPIFKRK